MLMLRGGPPERWVNIVGWRAAHCASPPPALEYALPHTTLLAHLPTLLDACLPAPPCRCPQAVTNAGLLHLACRLPRLTWLNLSEAQQLTTGGLAAALPLLPCLAHLDLTAASSEHLRDEQLVQLLRGGGSGPPATAANVQLPQGASSPTGSPLKRRGAAAVAV